MKLNYLNSFFVWRLPGQILKRAEMLNSFLELNFFVDIFKIYRYIFINLAERISVFIFFVKINNENMLQQFSNVFFSKYIFLVFSMIELGAHTKYCNEILEKFCFFSGKSMNCNYEIRHIFQDKQKILIKDFFCLFVCLFFKLLYLF